MIDANKSLIRTMSDMHVWVCLYEFITCLIL